MLNFKHLVNLSLTGSEVLSEFSLQWRLILEIASQWIGLQWFSAAWFPGWHTIQCDYCRLLVIGWVLPQVFQLLMRGLHLRRECCLFIRFEFSKGRLRVHWEAWRWPATVLNPEAYRSIGSTVIASVRTECFNLLIWLNILLQLKKCFIVKYLLT